YGHVIVDEAQELSPMAWRLVMRRCPTRSMTLVGDIAQTGDLSGAASWGEVLSPFVANRWRLEQLTVNYRTPSEIADVADDVLAAIEPGLAAPRSVRSTGVPPRAVNVELVPGPDGVPTATALEDTVAKVLAEETGAVGDGRTAVLAPAARVASLRERLLGTGDPEADDAGAEMDVDLTAPVVVLPVTAAKGLEFDAVVVVEPAELLAESVRGANDLYVALTRSTQRLAVVHAQPLPVMLHRLHHT
ncbi:MAG TPA: ATP-binding domain-containing protein, partial [Pseudonocardia sp.]